MECSNDEPQLCASILAHELVIDAVRTVVEKGRLSPPDEEHVFLCLHPTSFDRNEIEFLCQSDEITFKAPEKREISDLRRLVETELNETFSLIDRLDAACGCLEKADQLSEHNLVSKVSQLHGTSVNLIPELDKLHKRGKIFSQLTKDMLQPVLTTTSALKSEFLQSKSEISLVETSLLNEKYRNISNDALELLVDELEVEVKAGGSENNSEELNEDLKAAASKLEGINEEIAMKRALCEAFVFD